MVEFEKCLKIFVNIVFGMQAVTENACLSMPLIVIAIKVVVFLIRRDVVTDLITFSEQNFWTAPYDDYGEKIMKQCEKRGVILLYTLSASVQATVISYVTAPMIGERISCQVSTSAKVLGCNSSEITPISSNHFT